MAKHERRVLDLSVPQTQRQPLLQHTGNLQHRQIRQPVYTPPNRVVNQPMLLQGVQNPIVTHTGMGPFEHRRPQEPQQTTQTHPPVQKKPVPTESKEKTVIINGCDVTGCTTIAEAYEKNSGKIKFLLA